MRFDVKLFVPIPNRTMAWLATCHIILVWLAIKAIGASLHLRALAQQVIPGDIWSASANELLTWAGSITLYYASFILLLVNFVAAPFVVSQWLKTQGLGWPALWLGVFTAIYANVWLHWAVQSLT